MVDLNSLPSDEAHLRSAIERFFFAYRAFTEPPDRILGEQGLGRVHHRILYFVGRHAAIAVSELLAILRVSKQALNAPLRRLIELELIEMVPSQHDRRVRLLSLTASGSALEARLTGSQIDLLRGAFSSAGAEAEAGWQEVMVRLSEGG